MVFAPIFLFGIGGILGEQALVVQEEGKKPERERIN
jgi:hypothetical protein